MHLSIPISKTIINHIFKSRFLYVVLLGIIISLLIRELVPIPKEGKIENGSLYAKLLTIGIIFFVWEGGLRIDRWMNKVFPWDKKPVKRVVSQSIINIVYSITVILIGITLFGYFVCKFSVETKEKMNNASVVIGVFVTLIIMSIEVGMQFFKKWKMSLAEVEKYKKESLQAQLENLKSQVNPHFLFNSLSVLSSLVYKDQDKAVDFINQFSKVYRYILDNKSKELIELETELKFIESYCYLLTIRFGEGIKFNFNIAPDKLYNLLPPMAVQLLIENTIKHNETSLEMPLHVTIYTKDDYLIVSNNWQARKLNEESSGMGLKNIMSRYCYYTKMEVHINTSEKTFEVQLPLLKSA